MYVKLKPHSKFMKTTAVWKFHYDLIILNVAKNVIIMKIGWGFTLLHVEKVYFIKNMNTKYNEILNKKKLCKLFMVTCMLQFYFLWKMSLRFMERGTKDDTWNCSYFYF